MLRSCGRAPRSIDERPDGTRFTGESALVEEHDTVVGTTRVPVLHGQRQEPSAVVRDDGTALGLRTLEQVRVRQASRIGSLGDGDGVQPPTPELPGDRRRRSSRRAAASRDQVLLAMPALL